MLVRMLIGIGGYRNLEPWPAAGEMIDLPDHEAADLIAQGYAEEATSEAPVVAGHGQPDPAADGQPDPAAVSHEAVRPKGRRKV